MERRGSSNSYITGDQSSAMCEVATLFIGQLLVPLHSPG
jgi:hypothetical protein